MIDIDGIYEKVCGLIAEFYSIPQPTEFEKWQFLEHLGHLTSVIID